jgi:hypothetical protein
MPQPVAGGSRRAGASARTKHWPTRGSAGCEQHAALAAGDVGPAHAPGAGRFQGRRLACGTVPGGLPQCWVFALDGLFTGARCCALAAGAARVDRACRLLGGSSVVVAGLRF